MSLPALSEVTVLMVEQYGRSAELREAVNHEIPACAALNRYLFLQVRFWLGPAAASILTRDGDRPALDGSTFVRILRVFHLCNAYSTTADVGFSHTQ